MEGDAAVALAVNSVFIFVAAVLVLFMQAGFAMLEVGFSRMKNAGAVMAKIFLNLSIAAVVFWAFGYGLIYGGDTTDFGAFFGGGGFFIDFSNTDEFAADFYGGEALSLLPGVDWFFQLAFCAVSLAIVFGTMLDRMKLAGYAIFAVIFVALIYPTVARWTWGGGWLAEDGFLDFAGSSIVHLAGATAGLAGTLLIGPRIGKFKDGKAVPIPGHSMPLALLGIIILWVGWMGFNGGSTLGAIDTDFGLVAANTNLAAGAGVLGAALMSLWVMKTLDVSQIGNGAIGGLVAITAPCAFVEPGAAVVIGLIGGGLVPPIVLLLDRVKIDDPLGAIPAHGVAGIWGTLAIGLFATGKLVPEGSAEGLLVGGDAEQLWVQTYGVLLTFAVVFVAALIVFGAIKYTIGLRVSEVEELRGLDITQHGMFGYPERFIEVPGAEPNGTAETQFTPVSSPSSSNT
ncbi:MAG: ammonium transporter [Thermoleophilia bacterium]|nr:ammonium transporter [Thermoleophilia bacterium]